jgi:hypothetical protein
MGKDVDMDVSYPPLRWRSQFGDVDWHLCAADTNAEAVDKSTSNQHTDVLSGTRNYRSNNPDSTANLDGAAATKLISQVTREERTNKGTTRHSRCDSTLNIGVRTRTFLVRVSRIFRPVGALIEVATILLCGQAASCQHAKGTSNTTFLT